MRRFLDPTMTRIHDLPEAVLVEVLAHVPFKDLDINCRLVCSFWRDMMELPTLWKRKCQLAGLQLDERVRKPRDWLYLYFLIMQKKNLIKNPCAEEEFSYWQFDHVGGGKWDIEVISEAQDELFPDPAVNTNFVSSYRKSQLIDLRAAGYRGDLMDEFQPDIVVTDWCSARHDCGCRYDQTIRLISGENKILKMFRMKPLIIKQWGNAKWKRISYALRNYGPGVRYIHFQHGGKDTRIFAGWYGVRVTNTSVVIEPPGWDDDDSEDI